MRLQDAIGSQEIIKQMVLLPEAATPAVEDKSVRRVNLIVGYNSSPSSHTALDIALLIAHQTRLATQKQVTVHVVYVLDETQSNWETNVCNLTDINPPSCHQLSLPEAFAVNSATSVLTQPKTNAIAAIPGLTSLDMLEQADRILWQARCLAEEWKGTFVAHLRFGKLSTELHNVVESKAADLLLLGCSSSDHPVVQQLGANFPCPVLGIPTLVTSGSYDLA